MHLWIQLKGQQYILYLLHLHIQHHKVANAGEETRILVKPFSSCPLWKYGAEV